MYSHRKSLFSLASIVLLMLLTVFAQAATYYVAADGNDSNDGLTTATAFQTIQHGIDAATQDGDIVLVAAGTYNEHNIVHIRKQFPFPAIVPNAKEWKLVLDEHIDFMGKNIIVHGAGIFGTYLDCQGAGRGFLFHNGETRAAKLSGFFITNCQADDTLPVTLSAELLETLFGGDAPEEGFPIPAGNVIRIVDSSPTITDCLISSDYTNEGVGGGIAVSGGSPRVVNCIFVYNFGLLGGAIYAEESSLEVINTVLVFNAGLIGSGVFANGGNVTLINDTFTQIFPIDDSFGPLASTVVGALDTSILVANSILWDNGAPGNLNAADAGSSITVRNSDVQGSGGSVGWSLAGLTDDGNNIDADPVLDGGFLSPLPGSPCINTGDTDLYNTYASDITTGFLGVPRIYGGQIDMGWFEFVPETGDTTPPVITTPGNLTATATSTAGAVVNFTVTANDDVDGPVAVTCTPASGSTFAPGTTTVHCTAQDAAGNTASADFTVTVTYAWSGILQPINADGSSVFKAGSTIPIKFQLTGASAGITNLVATLSYQKISGSVPGPVNEASTNVGGDSGNVFRYDASSGQYLFNWSTKGLSAGTYRLYINLGDGVERTVVLALR